MASNSELQAIGTQGWLRGYTNLVSKESRRWWRTRQWLVQSLIWLVILNGLLAFIVWLTPRIEASQAGAPAEAQTATEGPAAPSPARDVLGLEVFLSSLGLTAAVGVVVLAQDTIINERQTGTAAWVMSKPASRSAFILSKVAANALGILLTMVVLQGAIAYLQIWLSSGKAYAVGPFVAALGLGFVSLLFYLTLTIMLGTLFTARGGVIGIPLVLIFGYQLIALIAPWAVDFLPRNLTTALSPAKPALAMALIQGQPLPTPVPLIATVLWCLLFTGIALWRFHREEF